MPNCQICQSKAAPRFVTARLIICQKCIKFLAESDTHYDAAVRVVLSFVEGVVPIVDKRVVAEKCRSKALRGVGFLGRARLLFPKFRSLFEKNLSDELAVVIDEQAALRCVEVERVFASLVDGSFLPKKEVTFFSRYCGRNVSVEKNATGKDVRDMLRIIRGYMLGIKDGNVSVRLQADEFRKVAQPVRFEDGFRCVKCKKGGRGIETHVHHIIPLARGGTNNVANLVLLCRSCHQKQHPDFKISQSIDSSKKKHFGIDNAANIYIKNKSEGEHGILVCPGCTRNLRMPMGRWLSVRCPLCAHRFEALIYYDGMTFVDGKLYQPSKSC